MDYKKRTSNYAKYALGLLAFFVVLLFLVTGVDQNFPSDQYTEQNVFKVQGTTIILGRDCKAIIAETSAERADSIKLGLEEQIYVRPNTHDIFAQTLKTFNISMERVSIDNYDGEAYYASMVLRSKEKELKLDAKPSDAFAVALRMGAPIYINKTLLDKIGKDIC